MAKARAALRIAARILAATIGAYGVTAGTAALIAVVLAAAAGVSRSDALIIGSFIAYLLFVFLMLWAFGERRLGRVWLVLLTAIALTHGGAMLIEPSVPMSGMPS